MADNSQQIQNLLGQLDMSAEELKELQSRYIEQKKSIVGRMESVIPNLARLADTQALRASVLRQLYWDYDISVRLLADAFGITVRAVKVIAGPLIVQELCEGDCGKILNNSYKNRAEIVGVKQERRRMRHAGAPHSGLCASCAEKQKRIYEAEIAQRRKEFDEEYRRNAPEGE